MVELTLGNDSRSAVDLGFAGDSLNTAIYLKRLQGESSDVAFTTVLGNDPLSARLIDFLELESINTATISRSADKLVGLYAITTDSSGERTFSYWRNDSAARTLFQRNGTHDFTALDGFDLLYLSAITLAILPPAVRIALLDALSSFQQQGCLIAFDSNYRPTLWESRQTAQQAVAAGWRIADIALPSIDDEMDLFGDVDETAVLQRLKSYGITRGALKRGSKGPLSLAPGAEQTVIPLTGTANVVDTTAAGDSFNAGYLNATMNGQSDDEALSAGHGCALRVIAHSGAIIPTEDW